MTPQEIFLKASEIEFVADRISYLEEVCGDDTVLRDKVNALLATFESPDSPTASMVSGGETIDRRTKSPAEGQVGSLIGSYKLLQEIGEGGFGVVYMAEQVEPIRRKVALKIVKPGMDSKDVIARFEAERQALALMEHPNIAKVFDGGVTEFGRPYFVMELVKGIPITEFCDKNKLSTIERVELCITACMAIDHAHKKGIIHRDIKPSNVMVTLHDGKPVCKVIDFGVSKALTQQLTEKTLFTAYGQMVGTPTYMSPEQAEMSGLDIDIRSDIYSLGVVLYELLTGTTPLAKQEVKSATYDELQRMIKEEEAQRPSTRVSKLGEEATVNAKYRNTDSRKLTQQLSGDLDWIIIKALEKDRNRRYDSAKVLAEDLQRHINQEAVLARPPSVIYKTQKFLRRNRLRVGVVGALVLVIAIVLSSGALVFEGREEQAKLREQADDLAEEKVELEIKADSIVNARERIRDELPILRAKHKNASVYRVLMELESVLEQDAAYVAALEEYLHEVEIEYLPEMSQMVIEVRDLSGDEASWLEVAFDPETSVLVLPRNRHRIRFKSEGFEVYERTVLRDDKMFVYPGTVDQVPNGMVRVPPTQRRMFVTNFPIPLFYVDQFEVSNEAFKEFVEAGGYSKLEYWEDRVVTREGDSSLMEDAIKTFVDSTGLPGPAHWANGTYPKGRGNFPVHSVSWYEASAFAKYKGQQLPTSSHWRWATHGADELIVPQSNFQNDEMHERGINLGIGLRPVYDGGGNVSEWVKNGFQDSYDKIHCGGCWSDPHYLFRTKQSAPPLTRSNKIGFRCIKLKSAYQDELDAVANKREFNIVEKGTVTQEIFEAYQSMYGYDKNRELGTEMISADLRPMEALYREEQVTIQAAYGSERIKVVLLFPRERKVIYHPIVFVPGADSQRIGAYDSTVNGAGGRYVKELLRTGRAVAIANYQGTFDRNDIPKNGENARRDWIIQLTKDVSRVVDYLETRDDIDLTKLSYFGSSMGAFMGIAPLTMEKRFEAGVLLVGGAVAWDAKNEVDPTALAPFQTTPVLMINGEFDNVFPLETSSRPLFELMGAEDKTMELYPSSHSVDIRLWVPLVDKWLSDRFGAP